ncbi:LysM peptidoglycan-binding domain-containing protein [Flavobacterium gelatinilyticum]|uniref:LysM peptidoglycan-binding domain-containing protein n=1 Tax=Flavobacterium gelatinilyticum TaxID=3003260 RepID=UPI0024816D5A|nr:peptidoglycan-binding protein LysM [Flavobacterium gelatinilyticum]
MYHKDKPDGSPYDQFRTYKIKKGDTLASVARDLGVEADELRWYHNMYCEIPDLIEADFKSSSEFLILAPEKYIEERKEKEKKKDQKVSLASNYRLPFAADKINESYRVKYTFEISDQIDVTEMAINVKWLATDKNRYSLFEITRSKTIHVNGLPPQFLIEKLGAKSAEVVYPLKIVVDKFGKWVDIFNYDEIESRWGKIKNEILDYYEGELTEVYIDHIEKNLTDSDTLLRSLRSDYFFRTFFNGIHVGYTADYLFKNEVSFPLEEDEEAIFEVTQKITPFLDEDGFIKVDQKGVYMDSGLGILYGYTSSKVNYSAVYFLNSETYTIEKMNVECNILSNEHIKKTIEIKLLE